MNRTVQLAVAGALAIAAGSAMAQTSPNGPGASGGSDVTLTLFSNSDSTPFSYAYDLGFQYNSLATTLPTAPGTSVNFNLPGLASDLSANQSAVPNLVFDVTAGITTGNALKVTGAQQLAFTTDPSVSLATLTALQNGVITTIVTQSLNTWLTSYFSNVNPSFTTSTSALNYANTNYNTGLDQFAFPVASSVGNAVSFYEVATAKGGTTTVVQTPIVFAGQWSINLSTDTLTYTVPGGSPVPLPAAVWLLMSGLAGMGVIGRRRKDEVTGVAA